MKNPNIVKVAALTLMVAALMPIRANANSGDRYVSNDTERPSNGAIHDYATAMQPTITTFDVPGAGTGPFQGPNVYSIAPNGAVTGFFFDPNNVVHGFVREADGALGSGKFNGQ